MDALNGCLGGKVMYCGKCGSIIPNGNTFCSKCGSPINDPSAQPLVQPYAQPVQTIPVIMVNQPEPVKKSNSAAVSGLAFGIVALALCWIPYVGVVFSIVGFILSIVGITKIRDCNSGNGSAITGLVLSIIGAILGLFMTLSFGAYINRAKASYNSVQQQSNKSIVTTNSHNIGNIKFEVPSSWSCNESDTYKYYYPDKNDSNTFLMVFYQETGMVSPTKTDFDAYVDGMVETITTDTGFQTPRIDKREIKQNDDFFIGKINLKATVQSEYREMLLYLVFDRKTGVSYLFSFTQIESVSEENVDLFNYITDSIKLR